MALTVLAAGMLLAQLQVAWATPESHPSRASGKALGHFRTGKAAVQPATPVTIPLAAPVTTIPPATLEASARGASSRGARSLSKVTPRKGQPAGPTGAAALQPGSITIKKDAVPDASETWHFKGDLGPFDLRDEVGLSFSDLKPGNYEVTEVKKKGWKVDHIVCGDPTVGASIQDRGRTITIALPPGGDTTCTFVGTRAKDLKGDKTRNPFGSKKDGAKGRGDEDLPFTGFRPDWFLFSAGMLLIAGGVLLRPQEMRFDRWV